MRDRALEVTSVLLLLAAGGFVWLTRHPDAEMLTRARGWPLVGALAGALQERWRPPPPVSSPAPEPESGGVEIVYLAPAPEPPRRRFDAEPRGATAAPAAAPEDEIPSGLEPPGPLAAEAADPERLARAKDLLGASARGYALGRYALWTDVEDPELAPRWRRLAAAVERAWPRRTGVEPLSEAAETVVLFRAGGSFSAFLADEPELQGVDAHGVAGDGLIVVSAAGKPEAVLDATFAHELAHLLARRSIGPALPPWLGEGLAEDVSHAPLDAAGEVDFEAVRGAFSRAGTSFRVDGGVAALDRLGRRIASGERLATLGELERFDVGEFASAGTGSERYALVFAWFRFLHSRPELAAGLRAFLAGVRDGGPATVAALDGSLPRPSRELLDELHAWVLAARAAALERLGAPSEMPDATGTVFRVEVRERRAAPAAPP